MLRAPWIERQLGQVLTPELQPRPVVIAHPAAAVLALLLLRVQKAIAVKRVVATVFEPASEHGQKGMDELHEQTVNLLSFQQLPKNIFDTQVAFNMVSRYGEQASPPLASIEQRILKHYQRISDSAAPLPSLLLLEAPIFHGYAFAIHLQMDHVGVQSARQDSMKVGLAGLVLIAVLASGCGYHTAGHVTTIPTNVQTIAIPAFVNQTQTYKIEQTLTAAVVREMVTRTHYHIVNS